MINIEEIDLSTLIGGFVLVCGILISSIAYLYRKERNAIAEIEQTDAEMEEIDEYVEVASREPQKNKKHQRKNDQWKPKPKDVAYNHPWYITTLKGHTNDVSDIDFASDGKKFISISSDRGIFLWDVRDFADKEHKCIRQTLDYDTPTKIVFAPDCKSVVCSVKRENKLAVFKLVKREGGGFTFAHADNVNFEKRHTSDISHIGIAANAKFLMSASPDTKVTLYDLRGSIIKCLDPKVSTLNDCRISPDGKFVTACGFTTDVFVYEPTFSRDGAFQDAKKVFQLVGHKSGVLAADFNATSTIAVTVSRDGGWKIFDTDIRYGAGQDAKVLRSGTWELLRGASNEVVRLAVSPTGLSFAVAVKSTLKVFSSEDENVDFDELSDLHSAPISSVRYSSDGKFIATTGDKYVRILRNVPELHSRIVRYEKELPQTNAEGARRRIKEQIEEAKAELQSFGF